MWGQASVAPGAKRGGALAALVLALALLACGSEADPATPSACLGPPGEYLAALEGAPGAVLLDGSTPIGSCIVEEQAPGELANVGAAMVAAASQLNAAARRRPAGRATLQLGYLVGAVQAAAASTGGIHEDLVLRLDAAARFAGSAEAKPFGAEFERAFGEGYAAAQAAG